MRQPPDDTPQDFILPWRIAQHASPAVQDWQGGYVLHHALSNDTHRLSALAGGIVMELLAAGDAGVLVPGRDLGVTDDERQAALEELAELGFITQ